MTHSDIYTKFMIEYDKADVTSSYPSLTEYEAAVLLDKAYLALIAQKLTGNNTRRIAFEGDTKAIEDLRPLIKQYKTALEKTANELVQNELTAQLPEDMLYYVSSHCDGGRLSNINLVSHAAAQKSKWTATNKPWLKEPVGYLDTKFHVFIDYAEAKYFSTPGSMLMEYIYIKKPKQFTRGIKPDGGVVFHFDNTEFECSDTMANELVDLAIIFASENTESPRLNSMLQTKQLEA